MPEVNSHPCGGLCRFSSSHRVRQFWQDQSKGPEGTVMLKIMTWSTVRGTMDSTPEVSPNAADKELSTV
jgi:hypothetical protein